MNNWMTTNGKILELTWSFLSYPQYYIFFLVFQYNMAILLNWNGPSRVFRMQIWRWVCSPFPHGRYQAVVPCQIHSRGKRVICITPVSVNNCILKHAPFHRSHSPRFSPCKINTLIFSTALLNKSIFLTLLK